MSLTDQQRTETAADNCEVLRARLARYEDADGKPITTTAEQAREIERLNSDYNEACEDAMCVARELERQKMNCLNLLQQLEDLKAQPSGVVMPERKTWNQVTGREGFIETEAHNACLYEVARLNSSPVSAGVVDERAAFETWYLGHFYMGDKQCGLEWLSTEPCGGYRHQHPAEQWIVWQARAALSAPSHGDQVRHMVLAGWKLVPVEPTPEMISAAEEAHMPFGDMDIALRCALFAAPSAGSQEQGE